MDLNTLKGTPPWDWPASAGQKLMAILRDRRSAASDRLIAAKLAGDLVVMNDEMADLLLAIVRTDDELGQLRAKAAISLGPVLQEADAEGFDDDFAEPPITEKTFHRIQQTLRDIHIDHRVPKELRRRVLEASVRAPQDWHPDAIRAAYSSSDEDWKLTAVFCMQWIPDFDSQILEALKSRNPDIQYEAVCAAGNWELDAAWPHVASLISSKTGKPLLLAAIEAATSIRPAETGEVAGELILSEDEEIAEAANEALETAESRLASCDDEDEDED